MRRRALFLITITVWFCLATAAQAQNFKGRPKQIYAIAPAAKDLLVGETLFYSVEWLGVAVGEVVLKTEGIQQLDNRNYYYITATAKPNSFFRHFVNLEYWVDSYFDTELHLSRRFEKKRMLNEKANRVVIDFNPFKNEAVFTSVGSPDNYPISSQRAQAEAVNPDTNKIPKDTQDLLSCLYYFRLLELQQDKTYTVNIYYSKKNWALNFRVEEPFRRDIRKKGQFIVFRVASASALNNLILGSSKFYADFTADSRRIPLEFSFNTSIGLIKARLQRVLRQ